MSSHKNPIFEYLHGIPLSTLADKSCIVLPSDSTVEYAVKTLVENHVLSAPVVNSKTNDVLGMIDMLDIVWSVLRVAPEPVALQKNDLKSLEMAGRAMAFQQIGEVVGLSGRDPYVPVFAENPISSVVELFSKGVHRAPIFSADGKIISNISQSTVIGLLSQNLHMGKLKVIGEKTVGELNLANYPPITVSAEDSVLKVLETIQKNKVSAVALVQEGKLSGNFSATDLSGMYLEKWPHFTDSIFDFLSNHSPNSLNSICARKSDTLLTMTKMMSENKIHRIWIVDDDFKPIGIVSATDIFKLINDYVYQ
jgi:CBS domain-containing protein